MKVKCITKCTGTGYENFEPEEVREIPEELGELLIKFKYAKLAGEESDKKRDKEVKEESGKNDKKQEKGVDDKKEKKLEDNSDNNN